MADEVQQVLAQGKKQATSEAFWWLVAAIIPTFGLAIIALDALWAFSGIFGVKLAGWQKAVIAGLNVLLALIIFFFIFITLYWLCTGFTGALLKVVGKVNSDYAFCSAFQ